MFYSEANATKMSLSDFTNHGSFRAFIQVIHMIIYFIMSLMYLILNIPTDSYKV